MREQKETKARASGTEAVPKELQAIIDQYFSFSNPLEIQGQLLELLLMAQDTEEFECLSREQKTARNFTVQKVTNLITGLYGYASERR